MVKIYTPGDLPGRDGINAPSPANPPAYPIGGSKRRTGPLTPSKGVGANVFRDDLNDNAVFTDDLGDGSLLIDDLAA